MLGIGFNLLGYLLSLVIIEGNKDYELSGVGWVMEGFGQQAKYMSLMPCQHTK